ncbi:MAG: preprotein translocase subunit SecY [Candidatus Lloydbacteria bacterium RIFCSPHIGHO2_01_FULL_49_22]|uniref:Protein translocase subunit SecY n=1 Tax=Candidatus Lloydbacteria bacterium RIFCSPHIGHO2_01_FULL_49_22 TaxID=1798658 RepID=A0A1G2CY78_9BACT|nr:MAG: preprotein translocase subunit SecY [Candidatus Lloydbacteria bacterium RIFCSPHIGHO2_01_FULL_49_22]OGZ09397.1 MAG: preprotein translocase subunit SecY [Candidatus Lloydbacteria bacterium RIFCSPHIGHO2_02_FULL_50_18]
MNNFFYKLRLMISDPSLRGRLLFVVGALAVFRIAASIPIPGVDHAALLQFFQNNQFLGLLNVFSGSGLSTLSIVMLGVGPYITGSIIMQLLTMMSPKLKAMYHEEGEIGRKKFTQYSRLLTVPLAMLQGYGLLVLLARQGVLGDLNPFQLFVNVLIVTAGSLFLMWIGELISEFGIGNGVSILIFAGIVSRIPTVASQTLVSYNPQDIPLYLAFTIAAVVIIAGVIVMTEAERPVPITYAKRVRGGKMYGGVSTYLPLRVNQAGVIPIIFALSILLFPQLIGGFLSGLANPTAQMIGEFMKTNFSQGWIYSICYFALVFLFTFFYTAVTFDPEAVATNLQKSGAFIPGVRPGAATAEHIAKILTRTTFAGALFLAGVAVLPLIMQSFTGNQSLAIGGTALLIVVSVVLDLIKKMDAQLSMREY